MRWFTPPAAAVPFQPDVTNSHLGDGDCDDEYPAIRVAWYH
jgi:hypothetical protein